MPDRNPTICISKPFCSYHSTRNLKTTGTNHTYCLGSPFESQFADTESHSLYTLSPLADYIILTPTNQKFGLQTCYYLKKLDIRVVLVGFELRKLYENREILKISSKPYGPAHVRLKAYPWPIHSTMQLPGASIIWPGRPFKI